MREWQWLHNSVNVLNTELNTLNGRIIQYINNIFKKLLEKSSKKEVGYFRPWEEEKKMQKQ